MENLLISKHELTMREWCIDVAIALAAFAVGCLQLMLTASSIIIPDLALRQYLGEVSVVPDAQVFIALFIMTVPLVLRRTFPLPVFAFCLLLFLMLQVRYSGITMPVVGPLVALYTVAFECGTVPGVVCGILASLTLLVGDAPMQSSSLVFFTRFQNIALMVAAVLAGYAYRTHRAYVAEVERRAAEAERTREEEAARRVEAERVRIAREVHDITAHSLSAVSIQLAAAERLVDRDPTVAKEAIATARGTAKSALDDIRSMIGVLRHGDDVAETMPAAGTDQFPDLLRYLRDAGLETGMDASTFDRALVPAHIDMALYTVAREACTNAVRHSRASRISVRLSTRNDVAELVVADDGAGCGYAMAPVGYDQATSSLPAAADGAGHGVAGMAERVHVLGGTFAAGDAPEGGFTVRAAIPLHAREA